MGTLLDLASPPGVRTEEADARSCGPGDPPDAAAPVPPPSPWPARLFCIRSIVCGVGPTKPNVIIERKIVAGSRPIAAQCRSRTSHLVL